jgi:hypothetical protein
MNAFSLPIIVSVMGILAGIVSIIGWIITDVNEKKNERMIRDSIVQNKTDPETAKILLAGSEKKAKKENPYVMLQAGLTLLGLALGYLLTVLLGIKQSNFGFWIMLIAGMGVGMILTFCIKLKLEEKKREKNLENKE